MSLGYTEGIARSLSKQSLNGSLFEDYYEFETLDELKKFLSDEFGYELTDDIDKDELDNINDELMLDEYDWITIDLDDLSVTAETDMFWWIEDNSMGGLYYIHDANRELVGVRMGVAGEHLGSVSVWLDTFNGTVSGLEGTFNISLEDCDKINEFCEEMFEG